MSQWMRKIRPYLDYIWIGFLLGVGFYYLLSALALGSFLGAKIWAFAVPPVMFLEKLFIQTGLPHPYPFVLSAGIIGSLVGIIIKTIKNKTLQRR